MGLIKVKQMLFTHAAVFFILIFQHSVYIQNFFVWYMRRYLWQPQLAFFPESRIIWTTSDSAFHLWSLTFTATWFESLVWGCSHSTGMSYLCTRLYHVICVCFGRSAACEVLPLYFCVHRVPECPGQCRSAVRVGCHEAQLWPAACPRCAQLCDLPAGGQASMMSHDSSWMCISRLCPANLSSPPTSLVFFWDCVYFSSVGQHAARSDRNDGRGGEAYLFPSFFVEFEWKMSKGWKLTQVYTTQCFKIGLVTPIIV